MDREYPGFGMTGPVFKSQLYHLLSIQPWTHKQPDSYRPHLYNRLDDTTFQQVIRIKHVIIAPSRDSKVPSRDITQI